MRKLIVQEFMAFDGVIQAPGDPDEDRSGGFDHGGWNLDYFDESFDEMGRLEPDRCRRARARTSHL